MHLHDCFQLAFSSSVAETSYDVPEYDPSFFVESSSHRSHQPHIEFVHGSVLSAVRCVASEWGLKTRTNFHIPPGNFAGYSYLFDDGAQQAWDHVDKKHWNYEQNAGPPLLHSPRRRVLVHAHKLNNLHPHHFERYDVYAHAMVNVTSAPAMTLAAMPSAINLTDAVNDAHMTELPITVPYIHPHLEMPVPPLHLPWYFGMLCWSYAVAGVVLLYFQPKWARCGGGRVGGGKCRRHWFPMRAYAMMLPVQSVCSFLADYVHMTNVSYWHAVDRYLACFMMAIELTRYIAFRPYTRPLIYAVNLGFVSLAVFCFLKSQKAQQTLNADAFVFWHNGWHCYPLLSVALYFVEMLLDRRCGCYHLFACEAGRKTKRAMLTKKSNY